LCAVQRLIREGRPASLLYVYKDTMYDLALTRVRHVDRVVAGARVYRNLNRADFLVVNRSTHNRTEFELTYPIGGALDAIPVLAKYQPSWWFKVELELDDGVELPPDPAADAAILRRIRGICAAATRPRT
jgi:hypothetical protein